MGKEATRSVTSDDALAAIVAGDRTVQQIADRFGIEPRPVFAVSYLGLSGLLAGMVCADLLYMQVGDGGWHYKPTKKGREHAAQQAIKAVTDRLAVGQV